MLHMDYLHTLVVSRCIHLLCKHQSLTHPQSQEPTCLSKPGKCQRDTSRKSCLDATLSNPAHAEYQIIDLPGRSVDWN